LKFILFVSWFDFKKKPMHYHSYEDLINNNKKWVKEKLKNNPSYFKKLSSPQQPPFLYIGCSDSRAPLTRFTGSEPGEMFVHRNVANRVSQSDENFLSVLQFAVENLRVKHIIICGHYDCGGIRAAYQNSADGQLKNWMEPVREIYLQNKNEIEKLSTEKIKLNRLSELNVLAQLEELKKTEIYIHALERNEVPQLHGWVLNLEKGLIKELTKKK
jgi:carbonic anhydrase